MRGSLDFAAPCHQFPSLQDTVAVLSTMNKDTAASVGAISRRGCPVGYSVLFRASLSLWLDPCLGLDRLYGAPFKVIQRPGGPMTGDGIMEIRMFHA